MKIDLLCSDETHPVNSWLDDWRSVRGLEHEVSTHRDRVSLNGGDILFLVSCSQLVRSPTRAKYNHVFVLHASDLPRGRGWSPHIWELLDGATSITLSLIEAVDEIDAGDIWAQKSLVVPKSALSEEINAILFSGEMSLMNEAIEMVSKGAKPHAQRSDITPTYYRRRTPEDSEIDPQESLSTLFNKIRLMDPDRYPAFFHLHGHTYSVQFKKIDTNESSYN